jgi:YVTN family beta-propeller protein
VEEKENFMKWIYMLIVAGFILLLSACSFESFDPIPRNSSIISTVNIKDMTVSFYDMDRAKKLPEWKVDRPYVGGLIFPDNDTFLLYGKTTESVDLYSLGSGKKIGSWETGKGIVNGLLVKEGKEVAFADQERDSIRIFNLEGKEISEFKTEKEPLTMLEAQMENILYVMSFNQKKLSIIDLKNKEQLPGFEIHAAAAGALISNEKDELWIGGHGEGATVEERIHIYDIVSGELKKEISAPVMPVNFIKDRENIFVLSHGSNMLYKLSEDGRMKQSIKVGANPFEIELIDGKLIVAGYDSNDLYIIDPDTLIIEKTVSVGKGPFQIVARER